MGEGEDSWSLALWCKWHPSCLEIQLTSLLMSNILQHLKINFLSVLFSAWSQQGPSYGALTAIPLKISVHVAGDDKIIKTCCFILGCWNRIGNQKIRCIWTSHFKIGRYTCSLHVYFYQRYSVRVCVEDQCKPSCSNSVLCT